MVGFMARLKRKDSNAIDDFSHHFSHFSLSSSPRKTRRLDADLPPIMEEEEVSVNVDTVEARRRAIVLFKPPPSVSLSVDSHLISIVNGQFLQSGSIKRESFDEERRSKEHLAVIPWSPVPCPWTAKSTSIEQPVEDDSMEVEEMNENATCDTTRATEIAQLESEGNAGMAQQWQQQHCMVSQPHRSAAKPVAWFSAAKLRY